MAAIDAKEKQCKNCDSILSTTEFYKGTQRGASGQTWNYYDSMCKKCRLAYQHARRKDIKAKAVSYLGGICRDCGKEYNNCVFDFHHLDKDNKDFTIGKNTKSFDSIKTELDKCVLLCANCHRVVHYDT